MRNVCRVSVIQAAGFFFYNFTWGCFGFDRIAGGV